MAILNSKTVIIPVIVLSFAAGAGAVTVLGNSKDDKTTTSSSASQSASSPRSPGALVKDASKYTGKTVTLEGVIVSVSDTKTYYLADNGTKSPGAIKLDFSKSDVDPAKLVTNIAGTAAPTSPAASAGSAAQPVSSPGGTSNSVGNKSSAKPVTVTGTVSTEASGQPVLTVKTVE